MIVRNKNVLDSIGADVIQSVIKEHCAGDERRQSLIDMYNNDHAIRNRARMKGQPNNRMAHGFARYIVTFASGYLLGKPVTYTAKEGQDEAPLQALMEAYRIAKVESVDSELAHDASVLGKGVEIVYADEASLPRTANLDPCSAFVVYDDTVEHNPLFGVHYMPVIDRSGKNTGYTVNVYTAAEIITFETASTIASAAAFTPTGIEPHFFGGVPMVEYWNNAEETGDFEQVTSLIDAYDKLESDRVNDKEQFVDAILVLTGARLENDENGRTPSQQLRQDKLLFLPDSDATAQYLARNMSEADVEVLKNALKADIHKFSMIPDLTDEQFAGNSSGVAMKFKLLGLDQLTKIKERWFREALEERLKLFSHFLSVKGAAAVDVGKVDIVFSRALPVNDLEISQTIMNYNGFVPEETLLAQVPFVTDPQSAVKAMQKQRADAAKAQAAAFNVPVYNPDGDDA